MKKTLKALIIDALKECPWKCGATATQIRDHVHARGWGDVKLSSLSSQLKKMVDARELKRHDDVGPRGGYGYSLISL